MQYAPIALFTYNRPDKTKRVIESLMQNAEAKDSDLFIFSDGPKNEKAVEGVKANREYLQAFKDSLHLREGWGGSITIIEREKNWGLANSLIAGITEVVNKYGKVIVVEDDLVLSPYFLKFMNDGLEKYKDEEKVGAISAYVYPSENNYPENFFLRYFLCWGWATWKRSWDLLETDSRVLLRKMRFKKNEFDVGGNAGAYGNLYCTKVGIVDSWWVRIYASWFLANKLTLYPGSSLVSNGGDDGSGTHSTTYRETSPTDIDVSMHPVILTDVRVEENGVAYHNYQTYFDKKAGKGSFFINLKSFVRRLLYIDCL